ncbi:MAG: succinate dehydrogenase cytochrome b subunit [Melioribacteraceae bacterium]|nr:MAG: succinate dehydrogenase cytochrome b subunit [Melioribacteraceae bacterium]
MGWLSEALSSSIGKKFIMAVTGICLILFLIIHLLNNLSMYLGPEFYTNVVAGLDGIKPLIRVIEVILALIFILHIFNGIKLWYENKKAKPINYAVNASSKNSSLYSRTMVQTGSIIFIFLVIHLNTMWYSFNFGEAHANQSYYYFVADTFANSIFYSVFYILVMILLGFHLNHGFQSAFQTFGWNHKKYFPLIEKIGLIYAAVMTIGFASIPIYFLFFYGGN